MVFYLHAKKYKKRLNGSKDSNLSSNLIDREISHINLENENFPRYMGFAQKVNQPYDASF